MLGGPQFRCLFSAQSHSSSSSCLSGQSIHVAGFSCRGFGHGWSSPFRLTSPLLIIHKRVREESMNPSSSLLDTPVKDFNPKSNLRHLLSTFICGGKTFYVAHSILPKKRRWTTCVNNAFVCLIYTHNLIQSRKGLPWISYTISAIFLSFFKIQYSMSVSLKTALLKYLKRLNTTCQI